MRPDTIFANGDRTTFEQLITGTFSGVFVDSQLTTVNAGSTRLHIICRQSNIKGAVYKKLTTPILASWFSSDVTYTPQILDFYVLPTINTSNTKAFNCNRMKHLFLRHSSVVGIGGTAVMQNMNATTYVYVPRSLIESYKTATNWSALYASYPNMFRAVEDYTEDGTLEGDFDAEKLGIEI